MSRKKKLSIIAGILLLLYAIAGFLIVPMIAESIVPEKINQHLDRSARIENIYFNPFTLALSIEGLEIQEKAGDKNFISFDRFFVNLQWSSIFKLSIIAEELRLENPAIKITRLSKAKFNFSDLIPDQKKDEKTSDAEEARKPVRFYFSNITISGGKFVFKDEPMDKTHSFSDINFTIPAISNFDPDINTYSRPLLKGDLNEAELKIQASTKPFADSLKTILDISVSEISLPGYFDYVPVPLGFSVTDGSLDINSSVSFIRGKKGESRLEVSGTADFSSIEIIEKGSDEILSIPSIHLKLAPCEPLRKNVHIETLAITRPEVTIVRRADGGINLESLGPRKNATQQEEQAEKNVDEDMQSPFILQMDSLELDTGTIRFRDFAAPAVRQKPEAEPVEIQIRPVNLSISDFSNKKEHRADLDFSAAIETAASLSVTGSFGMTPVASDLDIRVDDLDLSLAQPYFPGELNLALPRGRFGLSGKAGLLTDPDKGLSAKFTGDAGISDLILKEKKTGRRLTELKSFDLNGLDVSWNPAELELRELSVAGLKQQIVVEEDGSLNLANLYTKEPPEKKHEETTKKDRSDNSAKNGGIDFPLSIGEVKLADLALLFTDHNIRSGYSTKLAVKKGSIKGLSTEAFQGADAFLECAVDDHAPLTIAGRINPLLEEILLDLDLNLKNLELGPLSPYSGKYIGRAIEKGKLNLDLNYMVENRELEAENHIVLDQFSLGQSIESKEALNLPVGLAIALLKNRKGIIDLNPPVSGRLDDPEFSLAGIIFQALKNILVKAASSPFSLVSSIIKGGEEVRYIEFNPGSFDITDAEAEKLNSIQTLLYERPGLNLELTGYSDPVEDKKALAELALEKKIQDAARTYKEQNSGAEEKEPENQNLSREEYEKIIKGLYEKEVLAGPKTPEDAKPLSDDSLTIEEMKEKIRQQIKIDDKELYRLAEKRTKTVKNFILKDDRIEGKRLFLREAESLSPPEPGKFRKSRVELGLR
ncbi:MAG: DUF748 domain-containing protein [Desulfosalsimonas sp.]